MNRRDFLKVGGVTLTALSIPVWKLVKHVLDFPEAEFNGMVYRGTPDGEIFTSMDERQTWQKQTAFGADKPIRALSTGADGRLKATLKFQHWDFDLTLSENGKDWLVV